MRAHSWCSIPIAFDLLFSWTIHPRCHTWILLPPSLISHLRAFTPTSHSECNPRYLLYLLQGFFNIIDISQTLDAPFSFHCFSKHPEISADHLFLELLVLYIFIILLIRQAGIFSTPVSSAQPSESTTGKATTQLLMLQFPDLVLCSDSVLACSQSTALGKHRCFHSQPLKSTWTHSVSDSLHPHTCIMYLYCYISSFFFPCP